MAKSVTVEVSGDLAGIKTFAKQLTFASSRTMNTLIERGQKNVVSKLKQDLIIRGNWIGQTQRYGIKARFSKPANLEGSIGTAADWLLEEEGFHGGVKTPSGLPDKAGHIAGSLSEPIVGTARPTLSSVMPQSQKAGALLKNPQRNKVFVVISKKTGRRILLQRVGVTAAGDILRNAKGHFRIGRKSERTGGTKVVLKAVFRESVRVPQKHIFIDTATKTLNVNHYAAVFSVELLKALQTAKSK